MLTALSKALECVSHELPSAKLNVKLKSSAVRLVFGCLTNKKQQTKSSCQYSSWKYFFVVVSQRSVLEPLLFSIYLYDLSLLTCNIFIPSYAGDTTPYFYGENISSTFSIEKALDLLFQWFSDNHTKAKSRVMVSYHLMKMYL